MRRCKRLSLPYEGSGILRSCFRRKLLLIPHAFRGSLFKTRFPCASVQCEVPIYLTLILHFKHIEGFEDFKARIDDVPYSRRSDVVSGIIDYA